MLIDIGSLEDLVPDAWVNLPEILGDLDEPIAMAVEKRIKQLAHERLTKTRQEYLQGVQREGSVIQLIGSFPNMIEEGWSGGDMKPQLLASPKAKTGANGTYLDIPFRHQVPGTKGIHGEAMGKAHSRLGVMQEAEAQKMGNSIYQEAKKLSAYTSRTSEGGRLAAGKSPKLKEHHATDIHADMVRKSAGASGSEYRTFRRVSSNSDAQAWIHPGFEAADIFADAVDYAGEAAAEIIQKRLEGANKAGR